jgi:hypothetical protein
LKVIPLEKKKFRSRQEEISDIIRRAYQIEDIEDLYQTPYSSDEDLPARVVKPLPVTVLIHAKTKWKRIDKHTAVDPLHRKGRRRGRRRNKNKAFDSTLGYPGEGPEYSFCDTGVKCKEDRHAHLKRAKGGAPNEDHKKKKKKKKLSGAKRRFAEKKVNICKYTLANCLFADQHLHVDNASPLPYTPLSILKSIPDTPQLPPTSSGAFPPPLRLGITTRPLTTRRP